MTETTNGTTNGKVHDEAAAPKRTRTATTDRDRAARGPFATEDEARQHKPDNDNFRLFLVTRPDGSTAFTWNGTNGSAIEHVATHDGYTASSAGKAPASREQLAAQLNRLSAEDRALLISQFIPAPNGQPPAAPEPQRGKGNKGKGK